MKTFFDKFGGRKNFNFYVVVVVGLIFVLTGKLPGEIGWAGIIGALGLNGHYNIENKKVSDSSEKTTQEEL